MTPSEECVDPTDESLLETNPIQSPLQVFAGMGGLALIAERLPMLYPDVIQQVRLGTVICVQSLGDKTLLKSSYDRHFIDSNNKKNCLIDSFI